MVNGEENVPYLRPGDLIYSGENLYTNQENTLKDILTEYANVLGGDVSVLIDSKNWFKLIENKRNSNEISLFILYLIVLINVCLFDLIFT